MWRPPLALLLAAASAVLPACSSGSGSGSDPGSDEASPACDPGLDEAFRAWADAGFSGSIAISNGDEPECLAAYGQADEATGTRNTVDTVFSIGSVSKAFAAAAVLDLVDAGELSLSDRAGDVVDGLSGPAAGVTVEQLLLHTSGLTGSHGQDHEPLGHDEAVTAIGRLELAFDPGSDFLYSNAGYTLLALIVEAASGQSYRDYLASEILPLPGGGRAGGFWDGEPAAPGPRAVGYLDDGPTDRPTDQMGDFEGPHWALAGNGDLAMTMAYLASWTRALFAGQVVGPRAVELLGSLRFDQGDGTAEAPGWVALDASTVGEPALAVAGGGGDIGHDVVVAWLPGSERTIAMASNTPDVTAEDLLQAVGPALAAGEALPTPDVLEDVDPAEAAAVAGTYRMETGGSFDVVAGDGRLAVSARGADAVAALFPLPADVPPADVAAHEHDVMALLAGETQAGREERAAVESDVGPIGAVELAGTVDEDGELRTYVTVRPADPGERPVLLWYTLDDQGGVGAAEIRTRPPTLLLGRTPDGYRPDDPTGTGPDVTVTFDRHHMTIAGPSGTTTARLAG
jgi:CubicO group peptidase (beta-lactamase class C family)